MDLLLLLLLPAMASACHTVVVDQFPLKILTDIAKVQQASLPHHKAANAIQARMLVLLRELQDEHSELSSDERAEWRREVADLEKRLAREHQAAQLPMDELKAKHPRWIF